MKKPDIIIVDDHLIFRQGLKSLITIENIATVIAEASNGREFIDLLASHKPDLVLMDIDMPQMNGMEAAQKALLELYDQVMQQIVITPLGEYADFFAIDDSNRPNTQ